MSSSNNEETENNRLVLNTVDLWDDPSKDYRQRYELPDQFLWDTAALPRIAWDGYMDVALSLLPKPPARVIDVGCGPGMGSKRLIEHGYEVTGIDYNARGIEFAKLLVPHARFQVADIRLLSEITEFHSQFDAATHIEVFEHIPPQYHSDVLKGIHSTLQPGGILVLSVPSINMPLSKWHYQHFKLEEITSLINAHGFQVEQVVFQDRRSLLFSKRLWMLLSNHIYDIRLARRILRTLYLKNFNVVGNPNLAGRFIVKALKTG